MNAQYQYIACYMLRMNRNYLIAITAYKILPVKIIKSCPGSDNF